MTLMLILMLLEEMLDHLAIILLPRLPVKQVRLIKTWPICQTIWHHSIPTCPKIPKHPNRILRSRLKPVFKNWTKISLLSRHQQVTWQHHSNKTLWIYQIMLWHHSNKATQISLVFIKKTTNNLHFLVSPIIESINWVLCLRRTLWTNIVMP